MFLSVASTRAWRVLSNVLSPSQQGSPFLPPCGSSHVSLALQTAPTELESASVVVPRHGVMRLLASRRINIFLRCQRETENLEQELVAQPILNKF